MNQLHRVKILVASNRYPLALFIASRVGLFVCVYIGLVLIPVRDDEGLWRTMSDNLFLDGFARWDAGWYKNIAMNGYSNIGSQRDTAFFPAYPFLLSLANSFGDRGVFLWGIFLSNALFLLGLCVTFQLAKSLLDEKAARLAIALLAFAPLSVFFGSIYTESLFFASTSASFWLAKKGKPYLAMMAAAVASVTRVAGLICIPFAYTYFCSAQPRENVAIQDDLEAKPRIAARPLPAFAVGFSLIAAHILYQQIKYGNFLQFVQSQKDWSAASTPLVLKAAWLPILGMNSSLILAGEIDLMNIINSAALVLAAVVILIGLSKHLLPPPLLSWALCTVLVSFSVWTSGFRFVSAIFPVTLLCAIALRKLPAEAVTACSAMMMALFAIIFSHWYWVA